jgi:hydrogenase nickel incorporation protein HypB
MEREIRLERKVLSKNDEIAGGNRRLFKKHGLLVINMVSSPGSGKTSLIERILSRPKGELSVGVIAGDVHTDRDAKRVAAFGVPVASIETGGACHLDAMRVKDALYHIDLSQIDLLIIENVGNLVCPAGYDLGEDFKLVVMSVTEGDDKPLKYPAMFRKSKVLVINKIDLLPHVSFDIELARRYALRINPELVVFETSCTSGQGIERFSSWLSTNFAEHYR